MELRRTVALEAALSFSLPCRILAVDPAWPGGSPWQFALTVLMGATVAVLVCHLIPAACESTIELLWNTQAGRVLLFLLAIWLSLGAAAALFGMAAFTGSMLVLWQDLPVRDGHTSWRWLARLIAVACVLASMLATASPRWSSRVTGACLAIGVGLAVTSFLTQYPALTSTNPHMQSEDGLNSEHWSVATGMLLATAPAIILALRIGRMRLSMSRVLWSGFWGVWLPLIVSVALVSVAKMCGVRWYWKPSVPLDCTWAFVWMAHATDQTAAFLWPLAATFVPLLLVLAIWITDVAGSRFGNWRKVLALATIGLGGYWLKSPVIWDSASRSWLWSIILASLALGAIRLLIRIRAKTFPCYF